MHDVDLNLSPRHSCSRLPPTAPTSSSSRVLPVYLFSRLKSGGKSLQSVSLSSLPAKATEEMFCQRSTCHSETCWIQLKRSTPFKKNNQTWFETKAIEKGFSRRYGGVRYFDSGINILKHGSRPVESVERKQSSPSLALRQNLDAASSVRNSSKSRFRRRQTASIQSFVPPTLTYSVSRHGSHQFGLEQILVAHLNVSPFPDVHQHVVWQDVPLQIFLHHENHEVVGFVS